MYTDQGVVRGVGISQARTRTKWGFTTATLAIDETPAAPRSDDGSAHLRALLVEDEPADVELALSALRQAGLEITADVIQTAEAFTDLLRRNSYHVILADYKLPNWCGMESVEIV